MEMLRICTLCACILYINSQADIDADIRLPPSITEQNDDRIYITEEDRITELVCGANGAPKPEYEWWKNGQPLDLNDENIQIISPDKGKLSVTLGPFQEGGYQCFASNQYGKTMTDITYLLRAILGGFPPNAPELSLPATVGESLTVTCDKTKSVPMPTYSWRTVQYKEDPDYRPIFLSKRVQLDDDGNLYISHVILNDAQDDRLYQCVITNSYFGGSKFGSYATIDVSGSGSGAPKSPTPLYFTGKDRPNDDVIAIRGKSLSLRCLFAGNPDVDVTWTRTDGSPMPSSSRVVFDNHNTLMTINNVKDTDEGRYRCSGKNTAGTENVDIPVDVQSAPEFATADDQPHDQNVTEAQDAVFRCVSEAEPPAEVQWFMNGEKIDENSDNKPPKIEFADNNRELRVPKVCKNCADPVYNTDLKVYQCNASNEHGYLFRSGYLNVLLPTTISVLPDDFNLDYGEDVVFRCAGLADDSTPVTVTWFHKNKKMYAIPDEVQFEEGGEFLRIITKYLDKQGLEYVGEYTCVLSNGYSKVNDSASLIEPLGTPPPVTEGNLAGLWWVFVIIGVILLILLLLLICCICLQRNKGDQYPVDEKERANGNDPEKELADSGFQDYQRPEDEPVKGSRASLSSAMKLDDSDDDASLAEYGDIGIGKFNEDGSFIGQYNTADRRRANQSTV